MVDTTRAARIEAAYAEALSLLYANSDLGKDWWWKKVKQLPLLRDIPPDPPLGINERLESIGCTACSGVRFDCAEDGTFTISKIQPDPQPTMPQAPRVRVRIDRQEFSVARDAEITHDEAIQMVGKNPESTLLYWIRGPGQSDTCLNARTSERTKLLVLYDEERAYFTAPRIINQSAAKAQEQAPQPNNQTRAKEAQHDEEDEGQEVEAATNPGRAGEARSSGLPGGVALGTTGAATETTDDARGGGARTTSGSGAGMPDLSYLHELREDLLRMFDADAPCRNWTVAAIDRAIEKAQEPAQDDDGLIGTVAVKHHRKVLFTGADIKAQEPVDRGELRERIASILGSGHGCYVQADRILALLPAQGIVLPASEGEFVRMLPTSHMLDIRMRYDGRDYTIDGAFLKQWGPKEPAQGYEKLRRFFDWLVNHEGWTGVNDMASDIIAKCNSLLAEDSACPQDEDRGKVALSVLTAAAAVADECAQDMMPPRLWPLIESLKKAMEAT